MRKKIIKSAQQHFQFDRNLKPALTIRPGEEIIFETLDACCGEVRNVKQFLERRASKRKSGPLTGPLFIEGAEPGKTLVVDIVDIKLDQTGFQLIGPNRAIIKDEIKEWTCYEVRIKDNHILLPNGIKLPVAPVMGTFGNAPAGEATNLANRLGGNVDVPAVKAGARLYIPVEVGGALFSLGDIHACQGDGEVVGAPEIGAQVTVRFDLLNYKHSEWWMIEDRSYWHTACPGKTEAEAGRLAVFYNAQFITEKYNIELKDSLILLSMIGKLSISRTGEWGPNGPIVCSAFSKELMKKAIASYCKR